MYAVYICLSIIVVLWFGMDKKYERNHVILYRQMDVISLCGVTVGSAAESGVLQVAAWT